MKYPLEIMGVSSKPRKYTPRSRKNKALMVIDGLLLLIEPEDKLLGAIYRIAHAGLGHCPNPHEDWVKEIDDTFNALRKNGVL